MIARRLHLAVLASTMLAVAAVRPTWADEKLDLTYVNADAIAAVVLHPGQALAAPELELLPWEVVVAASVENLGIDPREIDEAIGLLAVTGLPVGEPAMGAIVRFSKPYDQQLVAERIGRQTRPAKHAGKSYQESTVKGGFGFAMVEERTLLVGTNLALKAMLAPKRPRRPCANCCASATLRGWRWCLSTWRRSGRSCKWP